MKNKLKHVVTGIVCLGKKVIFAVGVFAIYYVGLKIWSSIKDEKELDEILDR